jgi:hypothetical protein
MKRWLLIALGFGVIHGFSAERINHEGRILGPVLAVSNAVLFNTPEADAMVSSLQIFPRDNAWNEDISRRPVLANSDAMVAQITADLASNRRTVRIFQEMNFVLVPAGQPLVPIAFTEYPDESDPSPYPVPANTPIETWPTQTGDLSLYDWQRDVNGTGGDRHAILIQPSTGDLWETWLTLLVVANGQSHWQAANGAKFNLNSNAQRPLGWTSADAAGLSMFGGLIRYDECVRGMVEHAVRLVVRRTRRAYIYPASHYASTLTSTNLPAMGQRLRLKSSFQIPDLWTVYEKAVARALQKYGAIVADNGGFFSMSAVPDQRWPANAFANLQQLAVSNFEVIQTTGASEGPRSPGAPWVNAGPDQSAHVGVPVNLAGSLLYTNPAPVTILWKQNSGAGAVQLSDPAALTPQAVFPAAGSFTLMLSAANGIHPVAYDAVVIQVAAPVPPHPPCGLHVLSTDE